MKLRFHPQVDDDIDEVIEYTAERFGAQQAEAYGELIIDAQERLTRGLVGAIRRDDIRPGMLIFPIAKEGHRAAHGYICRQLDEETVELLRFVHLARHLPDMLPEDV